MLAAPKAASVWLSESAQAASSSCCGPRSDCRRLCMTDRTTGRITRAVDFERVLKTSSQARSPHFAVHHLASTPSLPKKPTSKLASTQLSTSNAAVSELPVDDTSAGQPGKALNQGVWLGMVVPKRHAKRAVTRTLLKRQIRAVMELQQPAPPGLWVVRLRAPFDRAVYVSAASKALSAVAREELTRVLKPAVEVNV
jgi:ribonuclease P protein component